MKPLALGADSATAAVPNWSISESRAEAQREDQSGEQNFKVFHNHLQNLSPLATELMRCFTRGAAVQALELFYADKNPDAASQFFAGWAWLNLAEWIKAEKLLKSACELGVPAHGLLAYAYFEMGLRIQRQEILLDGWRACENTHPVLKATYWREVGVQYLEDSPQASLEAFETARAAAMESVEGMAVLPSIAHRYSTALIAAGRDEEALQMLEAGLKLAISSRVPRLLVNQLIAHVNLAQFDLAWGVAQKLEAYSAVHDQDLREYVQFYLAWFDHECGRLENAFAGFNKLLDSPDVKIRFYTHLNTALLAARKGESYKTFYSLEAARGLDYVSSDRERAYWDLHAAKIALTLNHSSAFQLCKTALNAFKNLGNPREIAQCHLLIAASLCPNDIYHFPDIKASRLQAIKHHIDLAFKVSPQHRTALIHAINDLPLIWLYPDYIQDATLELSTTFFKHAEFLGQVKTQIMKHLISQGDWRAVLKEFNTNKSIDSVTDEQMLFALVASCELQDRPTALALKRRLVGSSLAVNATLRFDQAFNQQLTAPKMLFISLNHSKILRLKIGFTAHRVDGFIEIHRTPHVDAAYLFNGHIRYDDSQKVAFIGAKDVVIGEDTTLEVHNMPPLEYQAVQNWASGAA